MKRIRLFLIFLWCICVQASLFGQAADALVYVTKSGSRYHLESCSALSSSKIPVLLSEAHASGYTPCQRCNPPAGEQPLLANVREPLFRVTALGAISSSELRVADMLPATVVGHVDGDTVKIAIVHPPVGLEDRETVRLIGVDTPETVHPTKAVEFFGREASAYTKRFLLNERVYLAFDRDLRDRYGRLLVYIFLSDGICFNALLIKEGYAYVYTRFPFHFMEEFKQLQVMARTAEVGLWGRVSPE